MKAQERHHLKQNEFAIQTAKAFEIAKQNRDRLIIGVIAIVAIIVIGGGYLLWQKRTNDQASGMLGTAMAVAQSPIVPAPTVPGAKQAPGTYPTEQARNEAAVQAFQQVAATYPSTQSGIAAKYHEASNLLSMGKTAEAEQAFRDVSGRGGAIYGPMAKLGLASALVAQAKYDDGIKTLTELSAERDGTLPVDGVLMELGRVYVKAGKKQEARATFKRVVDEFPQSPLVSAARQQMTTLE
jgi:TolA-binding protein